MRLEAHLREGGASLLTSLLASLDVHEHEALGIQIKLLVEPNLPAFRMSD